MRQVVSERRSFVAFVVSKAFPSCRTLFHHKSKFLRESQGFIPKITGNLPQRMSRPSSNDFSAALEHDLHNPGTKFSSHTARPQSMRGFGVKILPITVTRAVRQADRRPVHTPPKRGSTFSSNIHEKQVRRISEKSKSWEHSKCCRIEG